MKKLIVLLLVVVLCLSAMACGGKKDPSEIVIGKWEGNYIAQGNATTIVRDGKEIVPGDSLTETLCIFKGGAAEILIFDNDTGAEQKYSATWEVSDGVLIVSRTLNGYDLVDSFEIHTDSTPYTLSMQGSGLPSSLTKVSN